MKREKESVWEKEASDVADQYFGFADWVPDISREDVLRLMVDFAIIKSFSRSK